MRVIFLRFLFLISLLGLMTSCAALDSILATPAPIFPTQTATFTPTMVWFPPSVTPSPQFLLTRAPTPEMRPNVGEVIFNDDFSDAALWDLATSDEGSANIHQNRLNLAAQSGVYMLSLRHETMLDDYDVEITAAPSLCRGKDSYGVLIRANAIAYYRFSLSCDGNISAEKVSGKSREVLQKPIPSGDVPLGAGEVHIGVWALQGEMRLFLNERYQFSVKNASYLTGALGVFVNAAEDTPVVISFSNLTVRGVH